MNIRNRDLSTSIAEKSHIPIATIDFVIDLLVSEIKAHTLFNNNVVYIAGLGSFRARKMEPRHCNFTGTVSKPNISLHFKPSAENKIRLE